MPSGQYPRNKTHSGEGRENKNNDDYTMLCLLPGRLRMKQLIEQEVMTLRAQIQQGRPELIAMLPGLETVMKSVTEELARFLGTPGRPTNGTVEYGARQIEAVKEKKEKAVHTVDVNSLVKRPVSVNVRTNKRGVSLVYRILEHLVTHGQELVIKEFVDKWVGEYPSLADRGILPQALSKFHKRGLDIKREGDRYIVKTTLSGTLRPPVDPKAVVEAPAGKEIPDEPPEEEAVFEGSRSLIMLQEFAANNNHVDINRLAKKYGARPGLWHPAVHELKKRYGAKIKTLGEGKYELIKLPKGTKQHAG